MIKSNYILNIETELLMQYKVAVVKEIISNLSIDNSIVDMTNYIQVLFDIYLIKMKSFIRKQYAFQFFFKYR